MNRRHFLLGSALATSILPFASASATDIVAQQSVLIPLFDSIPDRPGPDGLDFPVTSAINHQIQRDVWPENPAMYWDPLAEDHAMLFGFDPIAMLNGIYQDEVEIWNLSEEYFSRDATFDILASQGWEVVDAPWPLLQFTASSAQRSELATLLNRLTSQVSSGKWDWAAFPETGTMVLGTNEEIVHTTSDRIANHSAMTTMKSNFYTLHYLLPIETYNMRLIPFQSLPVTGSSSSFVARSWHGDVPIMHSIGLEMESEAGIKEMIETIDERVHSVISPTRNVPYAEFLQRGEVKIEYHSCRIDFTVADGDWDVIDAYMADDLLMLPPNPD